MILRHVAHEGGGRIERAAQAAGWAVDSPLVTEPGALQKAAEADFLAVMGGPMGVYEASRFSFITPELDMLRSRLEAGARTWGVCLGAQLIAAAGGGEVTRGQNGFEIGYGLLERTRLGFHHPLGHVLPLSFPVLHWHGDTFTLPHGALLLASSPHYTNQIFTIGSHILGLQCHLEVGPTDLPPFVEGAWEDLKKDPSLTPAVLASQCNEHEPAIGGLFDGFWNAFFSPQMPLQDGSRPSAP